MSLKTLYDGKKLTTHLNSLQKTLLGLLTLVCVIKKIILLSKVTAKAKCFCHKMEITEK